MDNEQPSIIKEEDEHDGDSNQESPVTDNKKATLVEVKDTGEEKSIDKDPLDVFISALPVQA